MFATFCVIGALVYWVLEDRAEKRYDLGEAGETDRVEWADLFRFGRSYLWVVLLCVTFYSAIFPFQTFAIKFFQDAHGATRESAGFLSSILTLFAMILHAAVRPAGGPGRSPLAVHDVRARCCWCPST